MRNYLNKNNLLFYFWILLVTLYLQGCSFIHLNKDIENSCGGNWGGNHIKFSIIEADERFKTTTPNGVEVLIDQYVDSFELDGMTVRPIMDTGIIAYLQFAEPQAYNEFTRKNGRGRKYGYFSAYSDAFNGNYCIRAEYSSKSGSAEVRTSGVLLSKKNAFKLLEEK